MNHQEIHDLCQKHMHRYVGVTMSDGTVHDGIVEHVDEVNLYLAVPVGSMEMEHMRAFLPYGPYGFPGYGFGRRRFARQVLPLAGLLTLSLLPYYW